MYYVNNKLLTVQHSSWNTQLTYHEQNINTVDGLSSRKRKRKMNSTQTCIMPWTSEISFPLHRNHSLQSNKALRLLQCSNCPQGSMWKRKKINRSWSGFCTYQNNKLWNYLLKNKLFIKLRCIQKGFLYRKYKRETERLWGNYDLKDCCQNLTKRWT